MLSVFRSLWIWFAAIALIILWLPLLALIRLFDHDPVHYRTGRWFRRLGAAMCKVNPQWRIHLSGQKTIENPRRPYVVVSNHQSHADIPILSNLPWEMKWVGKKELFNLPLLGLMMRFAGDIPVDRSDRRSGARMLLSAIKYLDQKCSVIFFPEGTRSLDGRVGRFNDGAFHIAIKAQVPILPVAVEGSHGCLPKKSWRFGKPSDVFVRVLPEVDTAGMTSDDVGRLNRKVRQMIIEQVADFRGVQPSEVDVLA
ncbi:MAG: lysophospholipid acyltransferase family protein [Bacteroidota bacterium]